MSLGYQWFAEFNVEAVACTLPTFEQIEYGQHLVYAIGNDGMLVQATIDTEQSERDRDNAEIVQMIYLGRYLRAARKEEAANRPVK